MLLLTSAKLLTKAGPITSTVPVPDSPHFSLTLTLCLLGNYSEFILPSADFLFQNQLSRKIISGIPRECQTVWIQIRPDISSCLIWAQTFCKKQSADGDTSRQSVKAECVCIDLLIQFYSLHSDAFA